MSWAEHHRKSEELAVSAEEASRRGQQSEAHELYIAAAKAELDALAQLDPAKTRTVGITVVSAASLFYRGKDSVAAESFFLNCLSRSDLQEFARDQLKSLLQSIWGEAEISAAGLTFSKRDVLVSVRGGEVVTGGAPLDLILRKVEEIRALLYRTVEMLMARNFRSHGGPPIDLQRSFRPWLFQAAPGSYQFAVRLESTTQLEFPLLGGVPVPEVETVTAKFLEIVNAAATDPENELPRVVPSVEYRGAFLKLTRSLAPTGKGFSSLEIRSAIDPSSPVISLATATRKTLTDSLRRTRSSEISSPATPVTLKGILRAVHLDEDWLEVTVTEQEREQHIRVFKAGDAIDDVVGPMVNRPVAVETLMGSIGRYNFVDIQVLE